MQATEPPAILIVDDRRENLLSLGALLEGFACAVVPASSGREALKQVLQREFALILLDVKMPEMDGFETAELIRSRPQSQHIPIIFLTAYNQQEADVHRGYRLRAVDFLLKPIVPEILGAKVEVFLDLHRKSREAREAAERLRAAETSRLQSELDRAREALEAERLRADVERERAVARELSESYARLKALEQLRDDLTDMIVHDLRTPLTALLTGLQSMELEGELLPTQKELLDMSISGGQTLLRMINDLLDISKMESGSLTMDREPLEPGRLIENAVSQVLPLARERGLEIKREVAESLTTVVGDEDKLSRALVNLLGNAVKFTPPGGTITVRAEELPEGAGAAFEVRDTGEGIPEDALHRIFDKFAQVEGRKSGRKMSTGLGLTFCKMVAEGHGGAISVRSVLGRGSTFRFTIPDDRIESGEKPGSPTA
jgi:signal transduction histidine kinase